MNTIAKQLKEISREHPSNQDEGRLLVVANFERAEESPGFFCKIEVQSEQPVENENSGRRALLH